MRAARPGPRATSFGRRRRRRGVLGRRCPKAGDRRRALPPTASRGDLRDRSCPSARGARRDASRPGTPRAVGARDPTATRSDPPTGPLAMRSEPSFGPLPGLRSAGALRRADPGGTAVTASAAADGVTRRSPRSAVPDDAPPAHARRGRAWIARGARRRRRHDVVGRPVGPRVDRSRPEAMRTSRDLARPRRASASLRPRRASASLRPRRASASLRPRRQRGPSRAQQPRASAAWRPRRRRPSPAAVSGPGTAGAPADGP
jgi:hypothetical protein